MIQDTTIIGTAITPIPINKSIPRDANSITPKVYQSSADGRYPATHTNTH